MFTKSKIFGGVVFLITASLFLISCSAEAEKVKIEKDIIGTEVICPVRGEKFTITESTPVVEYKGEKYYFCCPGCDTEFMQNPEKLFAVGCWPEELDEKQSRYLCLVFLPGQSPLHG